MGADNWAVCPKCKTKAEKAREEAMAKAAEAYGKVPANEWKAVSEAAHAPAKIGITLREDYDIGVYAEGEFSVGYSASCDRCGFKFKFEHKEQALA